MKSVKYLFCVTASALTLASCMKESSSATGWEYNNPENGGFEKAHFVEQETGPGLVFIEGGTFVMGRAEQDVMYDWNNRAARVTVSSFYMDQTEVTNFHWLEYYTGLIELIKPIIQWFIRTLYLIHYAGELRLGSTKSL